MYINVPEVGTEEVTFFSHSPLQGPLSRIGPASTHARSTPRDGLSAGHYPRALSTPDASLTPGTLAIVSMLVYFILSGDTEMTSGSGKPSATNYVNILLNLYGFIFTVLQQEKTANVQPMHETMNWYQHLLFGAPAGAGGEHTSGQVGHLPLGLSALLEEMDLNEADPNVSSEVLLLIFLY
ncbi:uncharacterized protein EI90DRAFT_3130603 [Cantharellus anzutake]|uniref:uncharacterized protein n=1 Tax=Cantharellus anzutake TaxID=1750568 RepID=UPI00190553F8|nr:uncharacterized protein EI90DRAFT_3130603 [Cantharellus anzutake]KAF8322956.1 hypothetical protein EI90DRAFT_3130603 [Cantharellus anzutake]